MSANPNGAGIYLPARTVSVPRSISKEAQTALALALPPGVAEPSPDDKPGWEAYARERNEATSRRIEAGLDPAFKPKLIEHRLSAATLYEIEPIDIRPEDADKAVLYIHGGAFFLGGGRTAAHAAYGVAQMARLRTLSIDYRMPPQSPYPAALDDALEAYRFILDRYPATNCAVYGVSAGGNIAACCLLKARDEGFPMPAACVLHSPEADLTESGDSFETNLGLDPVLRRLTNSIALYANGHDLRDPYISPLFGDFGKGFPPVFLTTGTRDLFLSNTVLMHRALRKGGVDAHLQIWDAMSHAGFYGMAPEDREVVEEHAKFITKRLSKMEK